MPGDVLHAWWDGPAGGADNMAADEVLAAEAARQGRPLVRFYAWSEPTFSLGGFQPIAALEAVADIAALPLVRRPSGGGGIVHGSDLTYAVAVPREHPWGRRPQTLYDAVHGALVDVLAGRGLTARLHPGRESGADDEARLLCFDRRARGDVVVPGGTAGGPSPGAAEDHKILGSSQRRLKAAVLQHGSLLLSSPRNLRSAAAHAGLRDLHPAAGDWEGRDLAAAWLARLSAAAGLEWRLAAGGFVPGHTAAIAAGAVRHREPAWLHRR